MNFWEKCVITIKCESKREVMKHASVCNSKNCISIKTTTHLHDYPTTPAALTDHCPSIPPSFPLTVYSR